ncbi:hypothetical protein A9Q99_00865 [Gammaproteobacteria bacterium 45_16_T64]|nr:hypothetical protein A9Q99_00865 [Gammaproteobacteria bacterium 45_16_T64]
MSLTLQQWLSRLESLHPTEIELGLGRIEVVYQRLAISDRLPRVVTVGGTNGKGSTVTMIEAIALDNSLSVGAYTSPHLFCYNERVRVNGCVVEDCLLVEAFEKIEQVRGDISLTYFEFGTLAALLIFADAKLDLVLLEVGLGGRLDATNVVSSDISVVTSVDIDHTDWLGNDRSLIAVEKCGIARCGKPFVCGEPDIPESLLLTVEEIGCRGYFLGVDFQVESGNEQFTYTLTDEAKQEGVNVVTGAPELHPNNVACALQVTALLWPEISLEDSAHTASAVVVPGRQQWVDCKGSAKVLVDVGHNPHAARSLARLLSQFEGKYEVHCLIAMMHDKDIGGVIEVLMPCVDSWSVASLPGVSRAAKGQVILGELNNKGGTGRCFTSPADALDEIGLSENSLVVVFGSFFTASAALDYFRVSL